MTTSARRCWAWQAANECANCRHYDPINDGVGLCRRFPPQTTEKWPKVRSYDWCGEFVELEAAKVP